MENTDMKDASALLVPDASEDSVDIYDGLDIGFSSNAEGSAPNASELEESMDLYEEIVTEEQQSRESSYSELQSRFHAAQNQIKELHRRLEQLEMQNTGLHTENFRLKKNISALLQTARQEVTRKDAEIQRLNQWSIKGHNQLHSNNLWDQNSASWTSTCSSHSRPPSSPPPPPPPLPTSPPREDQPLRGPPQPSKKERNNSTKQPTGVCIETSKASSHSLKRLSTRHSESDKHTFKHREEKCHPISQSSDRRHRTDSVPSKDCHDPDKTRSYKADKDMGCKSDSRLCKSKGHRRSDRTKSPPPDVFLRASSHCMTGSTREHRQDKTKLAPSVLDTEHSTAHSSKDRYSRDNKKIKTSYEHSKSSDSKDQIKSSSNQHAERCRDSSKDREADRPSKVYQRKEGRRRDDEISRKHKRSSLSKMSRQHEKQRSNESLQACSKERQKSKLQTLEGSSEEPNTTEKSSVEENAPNKKLCFMETLNLTLSPIKKVVMPIDTSQEDPPVGRFVENGSDDENLQPNVDDMCVIDEVNSSELEAGLEEAAELSREISERTHNSCDDLEDIQEKDKDSSKTVAGKPLEDNSVKSTSAQLQLLDTAENQITVDPIHKSPQSSPLKTPQRDASKYQDGIRRLSSDSQVNEFGSLEPTDSSSNASRNIPKQDTSNSLQSGNHENNTCQPVAVVEPPKPAVQKSPPVDSVEEGVTTSPSGDISAAEDVSGSPKTLLISPPVLPQDCQQGSGPPVSFSSPHKKDACDVQGVLKDSDAVSSTISLESFPQEGLSLNEAIYVLTQTSEDANSSLTTEPSSSTFCIGVSKVSSTTEETGVPEKYHDLTFTPKKSHENNAEPSSSVLVLHDEDSMIQTLSNLKRFPDAISPLRSPIRITKRSHPQFMPGHVKSLQNDFCNPVVDVNSTRLDINKENKYPGFPVNNDMQNMVDKISDHTSSFPDTELEEGEILSESDEPAPSSPIPATKWAKLSPPVQNKPNHKTVLKRKSEECLFASKEMSETTGGTTRSPKSRFKTVCPAATKVSFSSVDEIMETFKLVRTEIRKKYMKLHKTFPKKSFYGMMDNFQESFLEFVDGAQIGEICSQAVELKSKVKKLIASVFSKVSNNGIVKRIFEQQAVDLKQKLWDFVDVQVDYLFKDIQTTLKTFCKPAIVQGEDKRPHGNEKVSIQALAKKPHYQQNKASTAPTSLNRIKTCSVVPYRTGLGSRGKGIRITHVDKQTNADPAHRPNTQTVVDFLPPKNIPSAPEKNNMVSLIVSQNNSLLDKTDFEILTEQQASSLTFNLVRDSQMGEIFKCLLQGSDLLETSGVTGDSTAWSLSTPRKEGEKLLSITTPTKFDFPSKLLSPIKFDTPSKLIATWSGISPHKMSSPRSKNQIPLNPALFDESCLLEVPSDNRLLPSQKSYSILAEDLAVSLTIPSPLKSDNHLSFLQPSSMHILSTPDSVISAHISEDALLDGEDATEQDIHLTLDTDNSSCGSSSSVASVALATSFVFQPDKPMQALVMEKSNDHFIVKIRQAGTHTDVTLTADDILSQTLVGDQQYKEAMAQETQEESQAKAALSHKSQNGNTPSNVEPFSLSNFAESSGMCPATTGLTKDKSVTLENDPSQEDSSVQQINCSTVCFPEMSQSMKKLAETTTSEMSLHNDQGVTVTIDESTTETHHRNADMQTKKRSSKVFYVESQKTMSASKTMVSDKNPHHPAERSKKNHRSQTSVSHFPDSDREEVEVSESEKSLIIAEDRTSTPETDQRDSDKSRKRKKHQDKFKAKRSRKEGVDSSEETVSSAKRDHNNYSPGSLSPNSLSAKNVVRKKGEVVMAWTRDEDRAILLDLKIKGPSRETFSSLAEKLNKPAGQVAHRFYQLMKLFKKQEKMDT